MPSCHFDYLATIDVGPVGGPIGPIIDKAGNQIEFNAGVGNFVSIVIGVFLVLQLIAFARIFYKRSAGNAVLGMMIIVGVIAGPLSYVLIDHAASYLGESLTWECQLISNAGYNGNSAPNYYEHLDAIVFNKQLHAFFGAYIVGVHGFAAAWAANHALSRRLKTS